MLGNNQRQWRWGGVHKLLVKREELLNTIPCVTFSSRLRKDLPSLSRLWADSRCNLDSSFTSTFLHCLCAPFSQCKNIGKIFLSGHNERSGVMKEKLLSLTSLETFLLSNPETKKINPLKFVFHCFFLLKLKVFRNQDNTPSRKKHGEMETNYTDMRHIFQCVFDPIQDCSLLVKTETEQPHCRRNEFALYFSSILSNVSQMTFLEVFEAQAQTHATWKTFSSLGKTMNGKLIVGKKTFWAPELFPVTKLCALYWTESLKASSTQCTFSAPSVHHRSGPSMLCDANQIKHTPGKIIHGYGFTKDNSVDRINPSKCNYIKSQHNCFLLIFYYD